MTASVDTSAYDAARQFIHVTDTIRLMQRMGQEIPWSMAMDAIDCRYRMDRALLARDRARTNSGKWVPGLRRMVKPAA